MHISLCLYRARHGCIIARKLRGGQGAHDRARRRGRDPLRGPGRRPGDARDAARHRRARRRGPRRRGRADHRRPLLRRDPRADGRPHRAGGRSAAARSPPSATATRSCSTSRAAASTSTSRPRSSTRRLAAWTPPAPRYTRGVFAKYARHGRLGLGGSGDLLTLRVCSSLRIERVACAIRCSFSTSAKRTCPSPPGPKPMPGLTRRRRPRARASARTRASRARA